MKEAFRFGYEYQKVGIMLMNLAPDDYRQGGLFISGPDERLIKLSKAVDAINGWHGRDRVRIAGASYDLSWHNRRLFQSPKYTTDWKEILRVG